MIAIPWKIGTRVIVRRLRAAKGISNVIQGQFVFLTSINATGMKTVVMARMSLTVSKSESMMIRSTTFMYSSL